MRIKVFSGTDWKIIEENVNKFLSENKLEIYNILQSECENYSTITICYQVVEDLIE